MSRLFNLRFSSIANALHSQCTSLLNFAFKLLGFFRSIAQKMSGLTLPVYFRAQ